MGEKVRHPIFARWYSRMVAKEPAEGREHRRRLLADLSGEVIEVGAGSGTNFALYPAGVTRVVAVEPEAYLREEAAQAAASAPVPVEVVEAVAEELPFPDGAFDAAVVSLVLCSVPDQAAALGEARRVIRIGGELRFYEHVLARRQPLRAILLGLDRSTVWPRVAGGCHPARETDRAIEEAGFVIEQCDRFGFAPSRIEPRIPHILGVARRA